MRKAVEHKKSRISAILIGFGLFIGLLVLFVLVLWVNQRAAIQQVRRDFPAPGQLFNVQGNVIHLNCSGSSRLAHKAPTVVIDAGNASYSLDWSNLQRSLPSTYRVCTYDRPGYGWSKPSGNPRDADHIVEELHSLLQAAGEAGPYLLVGHSLGGLNMQLFAARYTDEVAGLILIEPPTFSKCRSPLEYSRPCVF
jgi:pimeloyl-ACP methyl ester carboxylesterase